MFMIGKFNFIQHFMLYVIYFSKTKRPSPSFKKIISKVLEQDHAIVDHLMFQYTLKLSID